MILRHLLAIALVLVGCSQADPPSRDGNAAAPLAQTAASPAEQRLLDGGGSVTETRAARAFIAPFTRADQASCFGTAELGGAAVAVGEGGPAGPAPTRVAIVVDGSGSMASRVGSRTKLAMAQDATRQFIADLPAGVPASLSVFGQQGDNREAGKARSCAAVDLLAPMSSDRPRLAAAVSGVRAVGWTPLAAGMKAAQAQLVASSTPGEQVIYVVSDGIETCGGDPVAVAREINRGSTRAVVNIIGFGLPSGEAAALQAVAGAGGGRFVNVTDDGGYARAMAGFRERMRLNTNRVAARLATDGNAIATGATATDVTLCTGALVQREVTSTLADYDVRRTGGETLPPRHMVVALLKERHDALAARRDAYNDRLKGARDAVNRSVTAREEQAR